MSPFLVSLTILPHFNAGREVKVPLQARVEAAEQAGPLPRGRLSAQHERRTPIYLLENFKLGGSRTLNLTHSALRHRCSNQAELSVPPTPTSSGRRQVPDLPHGGCPHSHWSPWVWSPGLSHCSGSTLDRAVTPEHKAQEQLAFTFLVLSSCNTWKIVLCCQLL